MTDVEKPEEFVIADRTLIKPIELDDAQGRWMFEPRADITALEAMLIAHMFSAIVVRYLKGDQGRFDWREYLTRVRSELVVQLQPGINPAITTAPPDLTRHFRPME